MPILITELKTQPQAVKSNRELTEILVKNDRFRGTYVLNRTLEDGSPLVDKNFTAERTFTEVTPEVMAALNILVQFFEQWRLEDEQKRAEDEAKAIADEAAALDVKPVVP